MTGNLKWHSCSTSDFPPKRHKVLKACDACRSKKIKCDGLRPCQRCENNKISCEYTENTSRARPKRLKKPLQVTSPCSSPSLNSILDNIDINFLFIKNDLYNMFRADQSSKSRRFGSTLLPLLLDFFNLNSQPLSIWNNFISCLNQFQENMEQKTALLKEAFNLFITHNLLYSTFIHSQLVSFVLDSPCFHQPSSPPPSPQPNLSVNSIVIDSILAITFFSAYQSLPTHQLNETLYLHAHQFYRKSLSKLMDACFPTQPADQIQDRSQIIQLVQAAVLLAHFQCQAIHEHQAYMTIRIALDLIHRYDLIQETAVLPPEERDNLIVLIKVVDAWHVWLSFYLKKQYSSNELVYEDKEIVLEVSEAQKWALQVTEAYTRFFKSLLDNKFNQITNIQSLKEQLKILSDSSKPSPNIDFIRQQEKKNSYRMIHLYHNILTIQLLNHQFDQIIHKEPDISSQSSQSTEDALEKDDLAVIECSVRSSQNIIATVNKIFEHNKKITHPDYSLALVYAICQVSQLALSFQKNKKLMHELSLVKYDNKSPIVSLQVLYIQLFKFLKTGSSYLSSFDMIFNKLDQGTPSPLLSKHDIKKRQVPPSPSPSSSSDIAAVQQQAAAIATSQDLSYSDNISNLLQNELLLADSNLVMKSTLDQIVSAPPSRTDIDREQLEKLSKPPTGGVIASQKLEQMYYQQQQQLLLQQRQQQKLQQHFQQQQSSPSSNYLFTKYISSAGITPSFSTTSLGKRSHPSELQESMMNEYYYNHYSSRRNSNKRLRSDTITSFDGFEPVTTNKSGDTNFHETPRSRHHSMPTGFVDVNEMTTETQHSDAFMYLLMDGSETSFYNDMTHNKKRHPGDNLTKLPLPQPSKPAPMLKTWTTASANSHFWSSAIFQESEVQTLHYPAPPMMNFEPSASFPMGLDVIHEEDQSPQNTQLLYPGSNQHRSSIISDKSSISSHASNSKPETMNEVENEAAAQAAAAAAAASWAVAVEIHQQQNKKKPRERSTGHWINNEKVPDEEEYWPNTN